MKISVFAENTSAQLSETLKRERFNVTLNELIEQCQSNGGNFMFDQILISLRSFRNFRNNLLMELNAISLGSPAEGDYNSLYWLNQICEEKSVMMNELRQLFESVQQCLNVENRLRKDEAKTVLMNMLTGVCLQLEFGESRMKL